MRVGILGSGLMGGKLGTIFARAGHDVVFSYARSEQKLATLAREAGKPYPQHCWKAAKCCLTSSRPGAKPGGRAYRFERFGKS